MDVTDGMFTKVAMRILCIIHFPCFYSINYYLVRNIQIHKTCALCGISNAISVLLTTDNSDDLGIQVPDESRSLNVTPVNS